MVTDTDNPNLMAISFYANYFTDIFTTKQYFVDLQQLDYYRYAITTKMQGH